MLVSLKQLQKETNQPVKAVTPEKKGIRPEASPLKEKSILKSITKGNIIDRDKNREKRKEMISAKGFEPSDFAYDRAIGRNDSLYSNFAELIALAKRKIGRIVYKESGSTYYGTGFMVSKHLLLTNWHVFKFREQADEGEVQFFYEYDALGHPLTPVIFKFDTTTFINDEVLDYCLVAVKPVDITGRIKLESIGYLYLDKTLGKIGDPGIEKLNIIHHPQGDYKQISIRENTFDGIESTKIFYKTDTAQGSSGSPVFNDQWQVVALHHRSVAKTSKDGKYYIDKNGNVIASVNDDKVDVSKLVWIKNEGIRISVILNHLGEKYPGDKLLSEISMLPPQENLNFVLEGKSKDTVVTEKSPAAEIGQGNDISILVPVNALSDKNSIEISLSSRALIGKEISAVSVKEEKSNDLLLEVAKEEKEQEADFSKSKGYDRAFLGVDIPLPQPKKSLKKQAARMKNNQTELKYFKYSVIFNAVRKMPIISAVNVEGDPGKRLDDSKRSDEWLRDKRIDIECQLTDKFYAGSHFDKGHMSRFEDANWDNTEEDALRNGIFTCFYTNACPQVVNLNRAGGLWGKLEKAVLEKGVEKETGSQTRITVFNGPVFDNAVDRIFKGVTIPMRFFKVILWLDDNENLKATAFVLSQETLVDDIKFDESMRIDEEALDIDKDVKFKSYQCSISRLSRLTEIDFRKLEKYDTFKSSNGNEEVYIEEEEGIMV